jgi:hypothetical protein
MLQKDKESDYEWERHGEDIILAIASVAEIGETIVGDIQEILDRPPLSGPIGMLVKSRQPDQGLWCRRSISPDRVRHRTPCAINTSTCRSFATISSAVCRFLPIYVSSSVKIILQGGSLQRGQISRNTGRRF